MAEQSLLTRRALPPLLTLAALVALLHLLALGWLARQLEQPTALRALATPAFTRLLTQQAPPATPVAPPAPVKRRSRASSLAPASAGMPTPSSPQPTSTAAAPTPEPPISVQAEAAASAPPAAGAATQAQASASAAQPAAQPPGAPASAPATASAAPGNADSWAADTRLSYRLGGQFRNGELYGSANVQWQRDGPRYQARVEIDVTLFVNLVLTSQGEVTPEGLAPRAYEEQRRGRRRSARVEVDHVVLDDGRLVKKPPGVQDSASQFIELAHRFATGQEALEVGRSVSFWMARPGGVDLWTYDIAAQETLRTPKLGEVLAFHLKPRPIGNPRGNITAEMWFAPSLQYLPVRIKVSMGEATYVDLLVEKIEQR